MPETLTLITAAVFSSRGSPDREKVNQVVIDQSFFIAKVKKPSLFMVLPRM